MWSSLPVEAGRGLHQLFAVRADQVHGHQAGQRGVVCGGAGAGLRIVEPATAAGRWHAAARTAAAAETSTNAATHAAAESGAAERVRCRVEFAGPARDRRQAPQQRHQLRIGLLADVHRRRAGTRVEPAA
jgi:hypothetical protein